MGLAVEEDTDTLLIAKTDGLWQQYYEALEDGGRLFVRNLTIDFRGSGHPGNFRGIHTWNKMAYLPMGRGGLLEYNVQSGQARDIKLSRQRIEGYRNFGTKLWNATRFCQMNGCARAEGYDPANLKVTLNRWIVGEAAKAAREVTQALDGCGFDEAANALYRFIWNVYCDWYVELAKPILNGEDAAARAETQATAAWVLDVILRLLHPIMPFVTEELWAQTAGEGAAREHQGFLMTAPWPDLPQTLVDAAAQAEIGLVIAAVSEGRSVRAELNVPPSARPELLVIEASADQRRVLEEAAAVIGQTLRVVAVRSADRAPEGAIPFVVEGATLALPVAEFIHPDKFAEHKQTAEALGFTHVASAPLVRSSYHADDFSPEGLASSA